IRSYTRHPTTGDIHTHKSQWGLPSEAEVRLRPGSTIREHATAPQGSHEYTPSGREPTIEARGTWEHIDLAHQAIQGTPEAERLHRIQQTLPHVQQSMFEEVVHRDTGKVLGYTPKMELLNSGSDRREGSRFSERLHQSIENVDSVVRGAGYD